jgi:hypothetical protein
MSIFSTLPSFDAVLNAAHQDAVGLIHAWLFNAGSGVAFKDYVDNLLSDAPDGIDPTAGAWDAGGGYDFNGEVGAGDGAVAAAFATMPAGQYTFVAGVRWKTTTGYQAIQSHAGGVTVGSNGSAQWNYGLYATAQKYYFDGVEDDDPQTVDTDAAGHVTGYHITPLNDIVTSGSFKLFFGLDGWGEIFSGVLAFFYIYAGETDAALQVRLAANPYAMFAPPVWVDIADWHAEEWLNASEYPGGIARCLCALWTTASGPTITARLVSLLADGVTIDAVVGTSAEITATTPADATFSVTLVGNKQHKLQVTSDTPETDLWCAPGAKVML